MSNLGPQFDTWLSSAGEQPVPSTHVRATLPIEQVREGDLFRESFRKTGPYLRSYGALRDKTHPSDVGSGGEGRMYVIKTERGFTPHKPEGWTYSVYRERS